MKKKGEIRQLEDFLGYYVCMVTAKRIFYGTLEGIDRDGVVIDDKALKKTFVPLDKILYIYIPEMYRVS